MGPLWTKFSEISVIRNSNIFIQQNALENVVCEIASILSRPQCVNCNSRAWVNYYIHINMRGVITHPWPNFSNGITNPPLWPRQNDRHFADDTFKRIFLTENDRISIEISLEFVPKGPINNITSLVQIMAWRRPGDKPLSEPMMVRLLTHICVTRPQWVKLGDGWVISFRWNI